MSNEIDHSFRIVTPGFDDRGKLAGEKIERIIGRHVVLRLPRICGDVEKVVDNGWRLQALADKEEETNDATDLMPQESRSHYAQLTQLRMRR